MRYEATIKVTVDTTKEVNLRPLDNINNDVIANLIALGAGRVEILESSIKEVTE